VKSFSDLTEQELLALAISSEDDDARAYAGFAHSLMDTYPASAKVFMEMAEEEHEHRRWLTELYAKKFGDYIPLIRRSDIQGFVRHKPAWTIGKMNIEEMRQRAEVIELENYRFYKQAAERSQDPQVKKLLLDLAEAEKGHESIAVKLGLTHLTADAKIEEGEAKRRLFLLQVIQPGLVGPDGRFRLHAGAALRRRLCHRQHLGDLPRRHRGVRRCGHIHGTCRRPFG
jgi:erythrin-vacuolar iron transport family protein